MIKRKGIKRGERLYNHDFIIKHYKVGKPVSQIQAIVYRIDKLRERQKMSIYELSIKAGIAQSTINEIMQGRSENPRIATLRKIASGFGMSLNEFFNDPIFEYIDDNVEIEMVDSKENNNSENDLKEKSQ